MGDSQFIAKDLIVDDPSKDDFKIHGSVYVDPEIFEAEIDKIFHRSWLYLAHESQIAHPNDYLTAYLGREPVILCRDDQGKIRCFLNRCRHRGTLICRSWQGNSSRFRCIFHGWSYRNDGTLIGVPGRQGYPDDFEMDELGLVEVPRIGTYKGFIFASLTQDVPSLSDHLGNTKHFIDLLVDRYPEGIEIAKGAHRYSIRSNWKLQAESELDFYHGPFLHKGFFDAIGEKEALRLDLRDKIFAIYLGRGHAIDVHHKGSDYYGLSIPLASDEELEKRLGPIGSKWSKEIIGFHMFVFPNLIIYGDHPCPMIETIRPVSVDDTEVVSVTYVPKGDDQARQEYIKKCQLVFSTTLGPAGMVTQDDAAVIKLQMDGQSAKSAPWNDLSRGIHRELKRAAIREFSDFEAMGRGTDDTLYRGIYRWWAKSLSQK